MRLLRTLTIGYVAVLVPTLATSLIAILVYLQRIAGVLGDVRSALATVADQTAPLADAIRPLRDAATGSAEDLARARAGIEGLAERLEALGRRQ
jgi:hypothetical protein